MLIEVKDNWVHNLHFENKLHDMITCIKLGFFQGFFFGPFFVEIEFRTLGELQGESEVANP